MLITKRISKKGNATRKMIICLVTSFCMIITLIPTYTEAATSSGAVVKKQVLTKAEYEKAIKDDLFKEMAAIAKEESEANGVITMEVVDDGKAVENRTVVVKGKKNVSDKGQSLGIKKAPAAAQGKGNNVYEYRTIFHSKQAKDKNGGFKDASKQPAGGYKGASYLYYQETGGDKYTVGISFSAPWSPVSVSVARGVGSKSQMGMGIKTTSTKKYNKVQAKKTYRGTPYSMQRRKKGAKKWTTFSHGVATKLYSVDAKCVNVK